MKNFNYIFSAIGWVGFVLTLLFIIFMNQCNTPPTHTIEKQITLIYDSTTKYIQADLPPVSTNVFTVTVEKNVDTAAILKSFFASYTYSQQIQDTSLRLNIFDSISQNKIMGRRTSYQLLKPVKTIESTTVTVENKKTGIYLGLFGQGNKTDYGFGPDVTITTKNNSFKAGVDIRRRFLLIGVGININARH